MAAQYAYIIDATLLKYQLISLAKIGIPQQVGDDITVKLLNGDVYEVYGKCHIDSTKGKRLRVPQGVIGWIRKNYPFSVAYIMSGNDVIWNKYSFKMNQKAIKENKKIDNPIEKIGLSWIQDNNGSYFLEIRKLQNITIEIAQKALSEEALVPVYPYLYSSIANVNVPDVKVNNKSGNVLGNIIGHTTEWLSAETYAHTSFPYGGIYILRRRDGDDYAYYVGKAKCINDRIVFVKKKDGDKLSHPNEKNISNKLYDDIICVEITPETLNTLFATGKNLTAKEYDSTLYYAEDIALHCIKMVLQSEGKRLDNIQLKQHTTKCI